MKKEAIRHLAENIDVISDVDIKKYLSPKSTPVVSIYVPVKRTDREDRRDDWDRIEFKDLALEAKRHLKEKETNYEIKPIMEKIDYVLEHEDLPLWVDASAGLGFLFDSDGVDVFNLSFAPNPLVMVGDEFYLKPLIRNSQYDMNYKLLLLNTDFFAVLDGNYNSVHYEPLPDKVKNYFAETFPEFDGETTALDYYSLEDHQSPFKDHKSRNDVTKEEAEKFFRYVNKAMNDEIVRDEEVPVILVTLPEHEHMFREICTFKQLLPESIKKDPQTMTGAELREGAVQIMEGIKRSKNKELIEKYEYNKSKGEGSDDLTEVAKALFDKKVGVLFVEAGKGIAGTYDPATGTINIGGPLDPVDDKKLDPADPDLINEFVELAAAQDSDIVVLSGDEMPSKTGVAATYRY